MEIRFVRRRIEGKTKRDKFFRETLRVTPTEKIIEQGQLRWLGNVFKMG